jgi:hypothetical protein
MRGHTPGDDLRDGVEIGAAMVSDHPLGVAGRAGGVVQGNRVEFVIGIRPVEIGGALVEERLVVHGAEQRTALVQGIVYVDHQRAVFGHAQGALRDGAEFTVDDENLCLPMRELEGNSLGIQADVQRVQHSAGHRHAKMRFIHPRHIRRENGDGVARPDAMPRQCGREPAAAVVGLRPGAAPRAVDKRDPMRMDRRRLWQEAQRRQRRIVRRPLAEPISVGTRPFRARFEDGVHWRSPN